MKTMVIMMGIQGSGKSTFYHSHLAGDFVHMLKVGKEKGYNLISFMGP